jgi:hypothetical protein
MLSPSSRADNKGGWPSIGQSMKPPKNLSKICHAYKLMVVCFFKNSFHNDLAMIENSILCYVCVALYQIEKKKINLGVIFFVGF